jgi:hypothetical protein
MVDLQDRFTVGVSEVHFGDLQTLGYEGSSLSACFHHHYVLPPISITLVQSLSLSFHTLDNTLSLSVSHVSVCQKHDVNCSCVSLGKGTQKERHKHKDKKKKKKKEKEKEKAGDLNGEAHGKFARDLVSLGFLLLPPSLPPFIRKMLQ